MSTTAERGAQGGRTTKERYGADHYRTMAAKRWANHAAQKATAPQLSEPEVDRLAAAIAAHLAPLLGGAE